jgi:hypothetical protein
MALQRLKRHMHGTSARTATPAKHEMHMSRNRIGHLTAISLALSCAAILGGAFPAMSAPSYDGLWSVVIVTHKGTCDHTFRYPIRISNGTLVNAGASAVSITGSVRNNGSIAITLSNGSKDATGSGRLSGITGAGSWRGADCAGTWDAERRSS